LSWRRYPLVKWYRILLAAAFFMVLASCGSPSAPRLPPADEDEADPDSTRGGYLEIVQEVPNFWA
jgi:hypothetical protein